MADSIRSFSAALTGSAQGGRAGLALSAAGMGEFEWDIAKDRFIFSERAAAITGIPAGAMRAKGGEAAKTFVHPEDYAKIRDQVETRRASEATLHHDTNAFLPEQEGEQRAH